MPEVPPGQNGDEAGESRDRPAVADAGRRPGSEGRHRLRRLARRGPRRLPGHPADFAGVPGGRERGGQPGQPAFAPGGPRGPPACGGLPAGAHRQPRGAPQPERSHGRRPGQTLQEARRRQALRGPLKPRAPRRREGRGGEPSAGRGLKPWLGSGLKTDPRARNGPASSSSPRLLSLPPLLPPPSSSSSSYSIFFFPRQTWG